MSATKYDVLAKLIERDADLTGLDRAGNYNLLIAIIHEISRGHATEDDLAEAIYDMIADVYVGEAPQSETQSRYPVQGLPSADPRDLSDSQSPTTVDF